MNEKLSYELYVQGANVNDQTNNYNVYQQGVATVQPPLEAGYFYFNRPNGYVQYDNRKDGRANEVRLLTRLTPTGVSVIDGTLFTFHDTDMVSVIVETVNGGRGINIVTDDVPNQTRKTIVENYSNYKENQPIYLIFEPGSRFKITVQFADSASDEQETIYEGTDIYGFSNQTYQLGLSQAAAEGQVSNQGSRIYSLIAFGD